MEKGRSHVSLAVSGACWVVRIAQIQGGMGGTCSPHFFFFVCLFIGIAIFQEHYDLKNSRDMGRDKRNSKVAGKKNTRKRIN